MHATTITRRRVSDWALAFAVGLTPVALAACGDVESSAAGAGGSSNATAGSIGNPGGSNDTRSGTPAGAAALAGSANGAGAPGESAGAPGTSAGAGGAMADASDSHSGGNVNSGGASAGAAGSAGGAGGAVGTGGSLGAAGSVGNANACPTDLIGFATLEGGTKGGGNATPTLVTTQAELRACATDTAPRVCRVKGTLTFSPFEEIKVTSQKTIIGSGKTAEIVMGGFFLNVGVHDVIIRNLTIRDSYIEGQYEEGGDNGGDRDGVQLDTVRNVWIDHCHFSHLGDGQIDSRKDTTLETVSWNILENHNKAFGIGWTDNVTAQITIHHNWLNNTTQRNPSTDNVLRAHLFNNLMENISSYGNYARGGTNMVLQNSVFVKVNNPHYYDAGTLVATGNLYRDTTGDKTSTGSNFSFFDPSKFYAYKLDAASDIEALLARCAGPRAELGN
jgi:pectate lyase